MTATRRLPFLVAVVCVAVTIATATVPPAGADTKPAETPPAVPEPHVTKARLDRALKDLPGMVETAMRKTGVPGIAVAVVWRDKVVFLDGFGVREVGQREKVDADTVFELASLSKPIASTVVAAAVGRGRLAWDDPVVRYEPAFALADPWVTEHVTIADMFSHRSGLPDHAGDLLEDLGYDRSEVIARLRQEPLAPFRANYDYTNFGLTAAGVAAANAAGTTWEDLGAQMLYEPLGMTSTSSRFADYESAENKAALHVRDGRRWVAKYVRDADAQSPAGGASSTVRDLAKWMRLQLASGEFRGEQVVDEAALAETHVPQIVSSPAQVPGGRTGSYGLGWNVGYDMLGRQVLSHSGAFALGAATAVTLLPTERLGIVVLSNGEPIGVPEAIAQSFVDLATYGRLTVDWLPFLEKVFAASFAHEHPVDYSKPPANATPPLEPAAYVGTYDNPYFGPLTVSERDGGLVAQVGPAGMEFPLTHYDANTFSFETTGENASGLSGVGFTVDGGVATKVLIEAFDASGLGTFTRA